MNFNNLQHTGIITWFAKNPVAANLLLMLIVILGIRAIFLTSTEFFPSRENSYINIGTTFKSASPLEVLENITKKIENKIDNLNGIKTITSFSSTGFSRIKVEIAKGFDKYMVMDNIKRKIDALKLSQDADKPDVFVDTHAIPVIRVVISGNLSEHELRIIADQIQEKLNNIKGVSQVLGNNKDKKIIIEIKKNTLKKHNLSIRDIYNAINKSSLSSFAGNIKTSSNEIFLKAEGKSYLINDFYNIVVKKDASGALVRIKDIAKIKARIGEEGLFKSKFNNVSSLSLSIYVNGKGSSVIQVAKKVKSFVKNEKKNLPANVNITAWADNAVVIKDRINLMLKSAVSSSILVIIILSLFLHPKVGFWVFIGLPVSVLGGIIILNLFGLTFNLLSLFAFILVLGIVVDDAIVTGENVYSRLKENQGDHQHNIAVVINATQEISTPVIFGVLTTVAAFFPMMMLSGNLGFTLLQIPAVVIPVLLFSLLESKLILPAHLQTTKLFYKPEEQKGFFYALIKRQQKFSHFLNEKLKKMYSPLINLAVNYKYLFLIGFIGYLLIVISFVASSRLKFNFIPQVENSIIGINLTMIKGTNNLVTSKQVDFIITEIEKLKKKYTNKNGLSFIKNYTSFPSNKSGNEAKIFVSVIKSDNRAKHGFGELSSTKLANELRNNIGVIPGQESLSFSFRLGGEFGEPINIELSGNKLDELNKISKIVSKKLESYQGVYDIKSSFSVAKIELQFKLKDTAKALGVNLSNITLQVKDAFYGLEVQNILRGDDEIPVIIRLPLDMRKSLNDLYNLPIKITHNSFMSLQDLVEVKYVTSPNSIKRVDGKNIITIIADVDKNIVDLIFVRKDIQKFIKNILKNNDTVEFTFSGEGETEQDVYRDLSIWFAVALFIIYSLLAIPLKSYFKPFIILIIIPFSIVGAILGHIILGMNLTFLSIIGAVALVGISINDSLILVHYIESHKKNSSIKILQLVKQAGLRRIRPVILTSVTTFFGVMPLLLETSLQSQFLKPVAVSVGFGILFSTIITLVLVPIIYLIFADIKTFFKKC